MNKNRNKEGAAPCKHCFHKKHETYYPIIKEMEEMFYAQCPECTYYDPYEFLGINKQRAIHNWNNTMESKAAYFTDK